MKTKNIHTLSDLRQRKNQLQQEMQVTESLLWQQAGQLRKETESYLILRLAAPIAGKLLLNTAKQVVAGLSSQPSAQAETDLAQAPASSTGSIDWQGQLLEVGVELLRTWKETREASH